MQPRQPPRRYRVEVSAEPRPRRRCWLVSDVSRRDVTRRDKVFERGERRQECQAAKIEHFNAMAASSVAQSHCAPRVGRPRKRMGATMAYNTLACLHALARAVTATISVRSPSLSPSLTPATNATDRPVGWFQHWHFSCSHCFSHTELFAGRELGEEMRERVSCT